MYLSIKSWILLLTIEVVKPGACLFLFSKAFSSGPMG